ncbi:MAG: bifunctional 4-hydroxy-2-oxoglutarate aldolase/2-dehydro-3-deoxy-phosphogluconate aldolase [Anaerolineales bacterium]|nr:bifunctional 4-hydroxy-2-oxoglutarate aldolase/2-dehydro-3-deoxy-phosphogluconate aldolase [Anaerolineales bacterium]
METAGLFETLQEFGVIPVIAIDSPEGAVPLADALIEGGLPVAEITFRTAAAAEVIARIKKERPQLILGAGTVLTLDNLKLARDCGAEFGVAPGLNPEIVQAAQQFDLPFIPGVVTPSEIESAFKLGARFLKFFPAEASGGVSMIKALAAPYAHLGIKFMPTGGVSLANLKDYLALDTVAMVGGTWIASKDTIRAENWIEIRRNCQQACELVARIRNQL